MNKFRVFVFLLLIVVSSAFAQSDIKISHGPYLQNMGETGVTIVWTTNAKSTGWVELAPNDESHFYQKERPKYFSSRNGIKNTSTIHSVKLDGLKPGTRYRYRIFSQEVLKHEGVEVLYGRVAASAVYQTAPFSFVTNNRKQEAIAFCMVNDIHGDSALLVSLLSKVDMKKTDFVLFNGDMVSYFNGEKQIFDGFMDKAVEQFANEIPMYYTRGNHETRGAFAPFFQDYFSTEEENIYFMFRQGAACFIVLDCGEDKPDSDIEYGGITVYDEYRTKQAQWLEKILKHPDFTSAQFKIVVCHMPPFGGWHGEQEVETKFLPLLNTAGVDLMLCGHLHSYIRKDAGQIAPFPIIVNSNNTLLKADIRDNECKITVLDKSGKSVDNLIIRKKRSNS